MMRRRRIAAVLFTVALAGILAFPGDALAQDDTAIRDQVLATWDGYVRAFAEGRVGFIADSVYTAPSFHGTPDGMVTLTSADELRGFFDSALTSVRAQGYDHSVTRASTVCPLTDITALLSVEYTRYRTDGRVLSEGAGTYLFTRTADGWRILGQIGHDADRLVGCGDR